jgi:NTP pyrophosphatase (non-canonical NTP hydrolase)
LITTLNEYSAFVEKTATVKMPLTYAALGLAGETGEVIEHIKKIVRDHDFVITKERKLKLQDELGDVLWYVTRLAGEIGVSLRDIIEGNVSKLTDRRLNGKKTG